MFEKLEGNRVYYNWRDESILFYTNTEFQAWAETVKKYFSNAKKIRSLARYSVGV